MKNQLPVQRTAPILGTRHVVMLTMLALYLFAPAAFAGAASSPFSDTDTKVCGFFNNINSLLNMASIAVVTLAVIIAGYQIAFAHKRIADVAPILIGGLLIGAATQIAKMLIGPQDVTSCTTAVMDMLPYYA